MRRLLSIILILIVLEVGILLFIFPWHPLWTKNYFFNRYAWVSALARNYFVRGGISGIGLADIGLAFAELWRLRQRSGVKSR